MTVNYFGTKWYLIKQYGLWLTIVCPVFVCGVGVETIAQKPSEKENNAFVVVKKKHSSTIPLKEELADSYMTLLADMSVLSAEMASMQQKLTHEATDLWRKGIDVSADQVRRYQHEVMVCQQKVNECRALVCDMRDQVNGVKKEIKTTIHAQREGNRHG